MTKQILSQSGIKIKLPDKFCENYDSSLDIRKSGSDNLWLQHLREFFYTSPTFNSCATRMKQFLFGTGTQSKIINNKILNAILTDYSIFGGFSLFVQYNGLGDIDRITHIPFETVRLGEQGQNGLYTYCFYSPDWSFTNTINKKKIAKKDSKKYWIFTNDIDTRLRRMNEPDYGGGEVLYFSNEISYPTEHVRPVINYVSTEVGITNLIYRDVRCNFMPATALCIPRQSDDDNNEFQDHLAQLQGDESSFKILTVQFSSSDDKPEALNLSGVDYMDRVLKASEHAKNNIIRAFNQEGFIRLEDGQLGFGSDAISSIYNFYNFYLEPDRINIQSALKVLDSEFKLNRLKYENL